MSTGRVSSLPRSIFQPYPTVHGITCIFYVFDQICFLLSYPFLDQKSQNWHFDFIFGFFSLLMYRYSVDFFFLVLIALVNPVSKSGIFMLVDFETLPCKSSVIS